MSGLDPSAPSQPTQQAGLNQARNPASKTSAEQETSRDTSSKDAPIVDHRESHDVPSQHGGAAHPGARGSGARGPLTETLIPESDAQNYSQNSELEGEQMRMAGEGDVARAVRRGGGGGHLGQESLTADVGRKEAEHEAELHRRGERTGKEIEEEEKEDWTGRKADVASALEGGRERIDEGERPKVVLAPEE
ncbi:hypothetical protein PV08_07511 [Exophiala spinifera]|uniref:Uncharacterized protein n=1 Tax=Exophiala spinifera TaxID=91928 RepID=A0A0D1ZPI0_9EURO|nr:uncharacterized protein PV08_07511 [Exophiala spinifera]KIW14727.1 hypothetical protein PV08_07511 [Exophiala spinifera]